MKVPKFRDCRGKGNKPLVNVLRYPFTCPAHQKTVSLPVRIRQADAQVCFQICTASLFDKAGKGIDGRAIKVSAFSTVDPATVQATTTIPQVTLR